MDSIMNIFFYILFVFFIYGYTKYYLHKHMNDPKPLYIPKDVDSFVVGGQENTVSASNTCNPNAKYIEGGDNSKFCLNGGKCLKNSSNVYNCSCVSPYSGLNCWNNKSKNQGVRIDITQNYTSPLEITRIPMTEKIGYNYYFQDNDFI